MDERGKKGAGRRSGKKSKAGRQRLNRYSPSPAGPDTGTGRTRTNKKKSRRVRRRRRNMLIRCVILIVIIIAAAGGFLLWKKYGSSNEKADLKQYYDVGAEDEIAVVINNEVIRENEEAETTDGEAAPVPGKIYDDQYYIEYSVVRDRINKRFYWDPNENILLYTMPDGNVMVEPESKDYTNVSEQKSEDYVILKTEGKTAYIALPFIQEYTNMEYKVYDSPSPKKAVINSQWGKIQTAEIKRDTQVRYRGGVKSPILTEIKKGSKVTVLEDENDWMRVGTEDGFVGYVKTGTLKDIATETTSRDFAEPVYSNISKDYPINMVWHNVTNNTANSYLQSLLADTGGVTTVAPTWFSLADTEGNITSIGNRDYVDYAHQSNLEVWAVLRDFHGGINSYDDTYQVLSYTSKRTRIIDQVIEQAKTLGIDGINLDFELVSSACGEHYIQFVRELSVKCRQNGLVLSVDNYVPQPYNTQYDIAEQGVVADYVIIMGYDEHTEGSNEAGSVATVGYLRNGIKNALKSVSAEKLIGGVPFFTRLWFETPKTEDELAEEAGTEAAQYSNKVTSRAYSMTDAAKVVSDAGAETQWDSVSMQNYAEWQADGGTYKIWLEDTRSLEAKMKVLSDNDVAGVAEWSLGMEDPGVWDIIQNNISRS